MKNMKKLVFLLIALLAVLALVGCGGNGDDNGDNGDGNGTADGDDVDNGNGDTDGDQWLAYEFDEEVNPASGGSGNIKTFTINSKTVEDGKVSEFNIEATYLGKENAQIATTKTTMVTSPTYSTTDENVTATLECFKLKHRVTVVQDTTGDTHPAWAEITCWIPTEDTEDSLYAWLYPKAEYVDSDGKHGGWSYYVTPAMEAARENPPANTTIYYLPATSGDEDFYGYNSQVFYGLYGWGWIYFQAFAEDGGQSLEEADVHAATFSYSCHKVDRTIGGYKFHAWDVKWSGTSGSSTGSWEAVFSADLPLPIYSKFGGSGEGSNSLFEYTLTDLQLD